MNPELMKIVERVVRPVLAPRRQKLRMREELLAHLLGVYDKEIAGGADPQLALSRVVQRFGPMVEVTVQLQQTVAPTVTRWVRDVDQPFGRKPDESLARYACRVAAHSLPAAALLAVLIVQRSPTESMNWREDTPSVALMVLPLPILVAALVVLSAALWRAPLWVVGVCTFATQCVGATAVLLAMSGSDLPYLLEAVRYKTGISNLIGPMICVITILLAGFGALTWQTVSSEAARRREVEWNSLVLD